MNTNDFLKNINDQLFITTEMNQQKDIYRWSPPEELETRFGVELEACIQTTPDCIDFDAELTSLVGFKEKFDVYYKNMITKSPYFRRLANRYKYLVIIDNKRKDSTVFYYDMTNPNLPGLDAAQLLQLEYKKEGIDPSNIWHRYHSIVKDNVAMIVEKGRNYELPMFVDDLSIICGESKSPLQKEKANIKDVNSFRFECITPILTIKGYPTKEKIKRTLYPLLTLFGLYKPKCFIQNFSMGFHVNTSLYNSNVDKYVAIAEPPFINQLLRNYMKVERLIYSDVRRRKPLNAPEDYTTKFARPLYKNLNKYKKDTTLNEDEIINTIMTNKEYMNEKYKGIKRKSPFLLEFRLFEADNDISRLVNHVFVTLDILHKTANEVSRNAKLKYTQPTNLEPNINEEPNINVNAINQQYYNYNSNRDYFGGRKTLKKKYRLKRKTIRHK